MDDVFRKWAWTRGKEGKVLTRLTWTGSALFVTLAAASAAAATPGPGGTAARNDLQRRMQSSHVARSDNDAGAALFTGPACEVPDHDSGNHLGWVKNRQNGLIGGSYGEVFFANGAGAGTRAVASTATGVTVGSGNGSAGPSAGSATTTPGSSTSATSSSAASVAGTAAGSSAAATGLSVAAANASPTAFTKSAVLATGALGAPKQQAAANPEPATLILLGTGLGTALFTERRRRSKK